MSEGKRNERIVKLKLDIIFKRVFGNPQNEDIIKSFLSAMLEIPIEKVKVRNVEIPPENIEKKFCRLDVNLEVDGRVINIELQINNEGNFIERTLFYWSKLYIEPLDAGEDYDLLRETICINIVDFDLFKSPNYHSHFKIMEKQRRETLTDKFSIHFFELNKIRSFKGGKHDMEEWLHLINAETEGELMDIEIQTDSKEIKKTVDILRRLSADEKVQQEVRLREKILRDETSALNNARREGKEEGRKDEREKMMKGYVTLINEGKISLEDAATALNMSVEEFKEKSNI